MLGKNGVRAYRSGDVVVVFAYMTGFNQGSWGSAVLAEGLPKPPMKFEATCIMQSSKAVDSTLEIDVDGTLYFRTYKDPVTESNLWLRGTLVYVSA